MTEEKCNFGSRSGTFTPAWPGTTMWRLRTTKKPQLSSADTGTGEVLPQCESDAGNICSVACPEFHVTNIYYNNWLSTSQSTEYQLQS
jgi:hypothetical protein